MFIPLGATLSNADAVAAVKESVLWQYMMRSLTTAGAAYVDFSGTPAFGRHASTQKR